MFGFVLSESPGMVLLLYTGTIASAVSVTFPCVLTHRRKRPIENIIRIAASKTDSSVGLQLVRKERDVDQYFLRAMNKTMEVGGTSQNAVRAALTCQPRKSTGKNQSALNVKLSMNAHQRACVVFLRLCGSAVSET